MSLFPAYSGAQQSEDKKTENEWLENKSFKPVYAEILQEFSKLSETHTRTDSDSSSVSSDGNKKASSRVPQESSSPESSRKRRHPPQDDDKSSRPKKTKKEKKEKKRKKKHKHKDRHRSPEKKESELDKFSPSYLQKYHLKVVFMEDIPSLPIQKAFRQDCKADRSNWQYGELYKMHIAKYILVTRHVLGSTFFLGSGKKMKDTAKKIVRYHSKGSRLPKDRAKDLVVDLSQFVDVRSKPKLREGRHQENFIRIEEFSTPKAETSGAYNPLGVYDKATEMYIQGKMQERPDKQEAANSVTSVWQRLQQKVTYYNKYLHEHPSDIEMWLEFVDFQDEAVMLQEDQADSERQKKRDALVQEIKESVMEKALQKNPASLPLQLAQMRLCNLSWESAKLRKAWKQLTFHHPNDPCVWWLYLEHLRTTFTSFTVSVMCKAYARCVKTLWEVLSGNMLSHRSLPYTQQHILDIILELVVILWQSGHMERASAICQLLLEFNLNCPQVLEEATISERLEFLEAFWDGSLPRIGEDDAQGWRHWVDSKGEDARFGHMFPRVEEENIEEELLQQHTSSLHDAWMALERSRSSRHWLPWHPDVAEGEGEDDCEDPERLVLFDDIKEFVYVFSEPRQQLQILQTYLSLLGVKIDDNLPSNSQAYVKNIRTRLTCVNDVIKDPSFIGGCEPSPLIQPLQCKVVNNLFEQTITKFRGPERSELTSLWLSWKLQEFKMATKDVGKKERKSKAKELKQFAKKLLSEDVNRNDLVVWEGYAVLEWAIGNIEEGDKVMSGALAMTSFDLRAGHMTGSSCQAVRLYRLYAEQRFKRLKSGESKDNLLYLLVTLATNDKYRIRTEPQCVTPVQLLKAKRGFHAGFDCLLSGETLTAVPSWEITKRGCLLEHWTVCYGLFEYLTSDLKTGLSIYDQVFQKLKSIKIKSEESSNSKFKFLTNPSSGYDPRSTFQANVQERLKTASVGLAQHHVSTTVNPLRIVRDPLMRVLSELPDSLPLCNIFLETESLGNILGQLRRRLLPVAKSANTSLPWIIGIVGELERHDRLKHQQQNDLFNMPIADLETKQWMRNTIHSLRSWIERALSFPAASNSVLLWRLFMFLEKEYGSIENVKAVFYRSIQQCPWAKNLYVDLVSFCPDHLQEVCDLLMEKELRLRSPLEELQLLFKGATRLNQETGSPSEDAKQCESAQTELNEQTIETETSSAQNASPESMQVPQDITNVAKSLAISNDVEDMTPGHLSLKDEI